MSIVFENVTYYYDKSADYPAINNISLKINENEFTCIIGKTGSGKSTLMNQMSPTTPPSRGNVTVDGMNTQNKEFKSQVQKLLGFVGQYPEYQLFAETVYDDIAFGPRNLKMSEKEIEEAINEAAEILGLNMKQLGDKSPFQLSGGQKRRVAIAGIMAMRPKYLLLDEPTAGLDPEGKRMIFDWLSKLKQKNYPVVMITHNMDDVAEFADKLIVLHDGNLSYHGDPQSFFESEELLSQAELKAPKATQFAKKLVSKLQKQAQSNKLSLKNTYLLEELSRLPITMDALTSAIITAYKRGDKHGV